MLQQPRDALRSLGWLCWRSICSMAARDRAAVAEAPSDSGAAHPQEQEQVSIQSLCVLEVSLSLVNRFTYAPLPKLYVCC